MMMEQGLGVNLFCARVSPCTMAAGGTVSPTQHTSLSGLLYSGCNCKTTVSTGAGVQVCRCAGVQVCRCKCRYAPVPAV